MKKSLYLPLFLLTLLLLSILPVSISQGQTEAESATELRIENQEKPKRSIQVKEGQKISVVLKDQRTYKGLLSEVHEDGLRIDSIDFKFDEIEMVRLPGYGNVGAKISGLVLWIVGLVSFLLGALMFYLGLDGLEGYYDCLSMVGYFFLILFGIVIGGTGLVLFLVGMITFIVGLIVGKAFKLGEKWRLARAVKRTL